LLPPERCFFLFSVSACRPLARLRRSLLSNEWSLNGCSGPLLRSLFFRAVRTRANIVGRHSRYLLLLSFSLSPVCSPKLPSVKVELFLVPSHHGMVSACPTNSTLWKALFPVLPFFSTDNPFLKYTSIKECARFLFTYARGLLLRCVENFSTDSISSPVSPSSF